MSFAKSKAVFITNFMTEPSLFELLGWHYSASAIGNQTEFIIRKVSPNALRLSQFETKFGHSCYLYIKIMSRLAVF
jgi:hypothetical protein